MLPWVVIDRTYSRQFLPKPSSLRILCLCVEFSDSFRPTSVVPTTYALHLATATPQPLCNQSVTYSFYLDGGAYPPVALPARQRSSRMPIPYSLSLYFSISCALFCTFLHSPNIQLFYFQAIPHSASKKHNHRGGGGGQVASGKYGTRFRRYILTSLHPCFLFREETASARRAEYRRWPRVLGTAAGAAPAPSLSIPSKC